MVKTGTLHLDNIDLEEMGLDGLFLAPLGADGTILNQDYQEENYESSEKKKRDDNRPSVHRKNNP